MTEPAMDGSRTSRIALFARWGLTAGCSYGLWEFAFTFALPALSTSTAGEAYTRWHLVFAGLLALAYAALGALLGLAGALALSRVEPRRFATSSLALAFAVNAWSNGRGDATSVAIAISALVVALTCSLRNSRMGPFLAALALVGAAWLDHAQLATSAPALRVASASAPGVLAVLAWLVPLRDAPHSTPLARVAAAYAVALVASALWIPSSSREPFEGSPSQDKNLLLIVLDTVRADHLSLYGYERETTPNIDRFAERADVYENAVAPGDMTLSSHASLFTGLYARSHGAHFDETGTGRPLDESFETFAERASASGYGTAGICANHAFFGNGYGLEQGFQSFDASPPDEYTILYSLGYAPRFAFRRSLHRRLRKLAPTLARERHYRTAADISTRAIVALDRFADQDQPFVLFVNYMDAHWPYVPPAPFDTRFPGKVEGYDSGQRSGMIREVSRQREREVTQVELDHMVSQYDGALAYIDAHVARLLDRLNELGLLDNTLVAITADHGEAFGEHQLIGHALSVYQDQVHVPLILRFPDATGGRRIPTRTSLVDLCPTFEAWLDLPARDDVTGLDLRAANRTRAKEILAESFPNPSLLGERLDRTERALFDDARKLIETTDGRREQFDLSRDAGELSPGSADEDLVQRLAGWLGATAPAERSDAREGGSERERLAELGYAGDDE